MICKSLYTFSLSPMQMYKDHHPSTQCFYRLCPMVPYFSIFYWYASLCLSAIRYLYIVFKFIEFQIILTMLSLWASLRELIQTMSYSLDILACVRRNTNLQSQFAASYQHNSGFTILIIVSRYTFHTLRDSSIFVLLSVLSLYLSNSSTHLRFMQH